MTESVTESVRPPAGPQCTLCHGNQVVRMQRMGWLENGLYAIFGYYPWRCSICRTKIYLRKRGRQHGKDGERVA